MMINSRSVSSGKLHSTSGHASCPKQNGQVVVGFSPFRLRNNRGAHAVLKGMNSRVRMKRIEKKKPTREAKYLREQASKCLELARGSTDPEMIEQLELWSVELHLIAETVECSALIGDETPVRGASVTESRNASGAAERAGEHLGTEHAGVRRRPVVHQHHIPFARSQR